jgi:hypothetical protein
MIFIFLVDEIEAAVEGRFSDIKREIVREEFKEPEESKIDVTSTSIKQINDAKETKTTTTEKK